MKLHAYMFFPGTCGEALEFYKGILDGEMGETHLYDGSPMESPESIGKIMHTSLKFGGNEFMAADSIGQPVAKESNITMTISLDNTAEAKRIFDSLSEGGTIVMPLEKVFWASLFGMCVDKFGINWMINCE